MIVDSGLVFCENLELTNAAATAGRQASTDIIDLSSGNVIISTAPYQLYFNVIFNSATVDSTQEYKIHLLDDDPAGANYDATTAENLQNPLATDGGGSRLVATLNNTDLPYAKYSINLVAGYPEDTSGRDQRVFKRYLRAVLTASGGGTRECSWTAFIATDRLNNASIRNATVWDGLNTLRQAADSGLYT